MNFIKRAKILAFAVMSTTANTTADAFVFVFHVITSAFSFDNLTFFNPKKLTI